MLEASVESMLLDQAEVLRKEFRETEEAMSARHAKAESDLSKKNKHEMQAFRSRLEAADATKARAESSAAIVVRNVLTEASKSIEFIDPTDPSLNLYLFYFSAFPINVSYLSSGYFLCAAEVVSTGPSFLSPSPHSSTRCTR